jgi:hypothetical protein
VLFRSEEEEEDEEEELGEEEELSAVAELMSTSDEKLSGFRDASRSARHAPKLSATIEGRRRRGDPSSPPNAASKAASAAATSGAHGSSSSSPLPPRFFSLSPSPPPKSNAEDQTSKPASDSRAACLPRETPVPSAPGMWTSGGQEGCALAPGGRKILNDAEVDEAATATTI